MSISITVNSCSEKLENMLPVVGGHYCSSCSKTVRDFTHFSDEQLISFFKENEEKGCGKFRMNQVNRLLESEFHSSEYSVRKLLSIGLLGTILSGSMSSCGTRENTNEIENFENSVKFQTDTSHPPQIERQLETSEHENEKDTVHSTSEIIEVSYQEVIFGDYIIE